jgi:hypothetical protein
MNKMGKMALTAAISLAVLATSAPAAATTIFLFDEANSYVNITSNKTICVFGSCKLGAALASPFESFSLEVGESQTFDFAKLWLSSGFGGGNATIDAQLAFIRPDADPAGTEGAGSYIRLGGIFTPGAVIGSLEWDTPSQQIVASDGTTFTVTFGGIVGVDFGREIFAPVTITLDSAPAVPEPATWAMMIIGFGIAGGAIRRNKAKLIVSYA